MSSSTVERILEMAILRRASDIHFQPQPEQGQIMLRVDGHLSPWLTCSTDELKAMISQLKYIAHMDIGEKRLPQDGSLQQTFRDQSIHLRLATMPTIFGEKLVVRIFPQQLEHLTFAHLGLTPHQRKLLQRMIHLPYGLLLVTGPTGSGKTTTMYKILEQLIQYKGKNICSLEDPVEMQIPALTQVQVHPKQGLTFANGLRAILRQDPDIIFVGEIRDEETAQIAVRAALTGHLVLSTLHTATSLGAITRLVEMGIKPYYVAQALVGVMTQRLFRLNCPYCHEGCYACFCTGYLGRQAVFELLPVDDSLRRVIRENKGEEAIVESVRSLQLPTLNHLLLRHVSTNVTSEEEVYAVQNTVGT